MKLLFPESFRDRFKVLLSWHQSEGYQIKYYSRFMHYLYKKLLMRLPLTACFFVLFSITALAQTDSLTQQINEQVWKPFINTYNNMYTEGFMALHSRKLLRIPEDSRRIYNYDEYAQNIRTGNENGRKNKVRQSIELRFTNRFIQDEQAFETGYYKTTVVTAEGLKRNDYGRFHVLLQKERDVWKIMLDTDAADNVDESIFQKGEAIE